MRLRTIALAVALACSLTATSEAKKHTIHPVAKSAKVKASKFNYRKKFKKGAKAAHRKPKAAHR